MNVDSLSHDAVQERLRQLGLRFAAAIWADPAPWRSAAEWLQRLPTCLAVAETENPNHPALSDGRFIEEKPDQPEGFRVYLYDDEAEYSTVFGPVCRRIEDGWRAALHRFKERDRERYYDFSLADARRISLLAAL